ncbi:MAG: hypothetical protein A7315_03810 [Candidatus Altiarchaeales archaeon WOR_SM1_79]|nr:MAG: hypothetical protein A7315_03810 [Candidatus Altiarchaeales archaeon WOR_SM1_79]
MEGAHVTEIQTKIQELPESLRSEAMDFIEFLTAKYQQKEIWKKKFKFDWEGGLSHLKEKLTSVDLQHKASGLR